MLRKRTFILAILSFCISAIQFSAIAQKSTAKATVQPVDITIGQQTTINLEVIAPKGRQVIFPVYSDTLISGIEVLGMLKADTVFAHEVMTITQKYIVTSFDSALYHVPFIPIIDGADTIKSNGFGIKVSSPPLTDATTAYLEQLAQSPSDSINMEQLGLYDIKTIQEPPFVWQDYIVQILLINLLLIIVAAIIVYIAYRKKKGKGIFTKPVVIEPPHVLALNALSQMKDEKIWQSGRNKEYYTRLTDILRKYIEDRFGIDAFEMTSDETLALIKSCTEADSSYHSLEQILKTADLVKFAKYHPFPDENDLSLVNSFLFVNQTKKEVKIEDRDKPENNLKGHGGNDDPIDWTIPDSEILPEEERVRSGRGGNTEMNNDKYKI